MGCKFCVGVDFDFRLGFVAFDFAGWGFVAWVCCLWVCGLFWVCGVPGGFVASVVFVSLGLVCYRILLV